MFHNCHRRTNHPGGELIILFHSRHEVSQGKVVPVILYIAHYQGRVSRSVVVCFSSKNPKPPRAPKSQCMQHAGPL